MPLTPAFFFYGAMNFRKEFFMEISQLRAVLAIAKTHSFSRAAQELYLSQSTLSLQVAKLEKELGVTLFYRTTRTVHLTEAGEEFVKSAGDILRNIRLLSQNMSAYGGLMRGTLTIGAISSLEAIHFSEMLASFYSLYPSLNIDLQEGGSISLIEMLRSHRIAQAFVVVEDPAQYPDLHFTYLGRDEYHLAVSRLHRLARRKTIELTDLENENLISHQGEHGVSAILNNAFHRAGIEPNVICRSSIPTIGFSLIEAGIGVGFFPAEIFARMPSSGVAELSVTPPLYKNIYLATLAENEFSVLDKTFTSFVTEWYKEQDKASSEEL